MQTAKSLMPTLESPAYGNYIVLHPNGEAMFRCNKDRAEWYLSRDLAEIKSSGDTVIIQLKFTPKGYGHHGDTFYLEKRENVKSRDFYDIVLLCDFCHRNYEFSAKDLKQYLAEKYNAPVDGKGDFVDKTLHSVKKAASAIEMFSQQMPIDVLNKKYNEIAEYLGHYPSNEEIKELSVALTHDMTNYKRHGEIVIEQVESIQEFVEMWRLHFLDKMQPGFMPTGWDLKRKVKI